MDWELLIAAKDESDLPSGHKRKKQGDIIAVKPAGWQWGKKELCRYLVVPVTGITREEAESLCRPYYEGGILPTAKSDVKIVDKRRYNIPVNLLGDWCPDIKESDISDTDKIYQPLKDAKIKIDFREKVAICKDKHRGKFRYATRKSA